MKIIHSAIFAVTLLTAWSTVCFAAEVTASCTKRVESYNYLVDYSGSMMMKHVAVREPKIELAKEAILKINAAMPKMSYQGGLYTFAPYSVIIPQGSWNSCVAECAVNTIKSDLEIFGRLTPMGDGIKMHETVINQMPPQAAVILLTDGHNNLGMNPVEEVKSIYQTNPNVCFHVVSFADDAEGKAIIDQIVALNSGSVLVDGLQLLQNPAVCQEFVNSVFCQEQILVTEEVVVLRGVNFAFDSFALDDTAKAILEETVRLIRANPDFNVRLLGWTDSTGPDAYNLRLSQERADAVKNFLVKMGIPSNRLFAKEMGKSYQYNNATKEGRYMNRRTELVFFD